MADKMINFDKAKFEKLKKLYQKAVQEKKESFFMDEDEFVTNYAKYVIEYLTPKFK